MEYRKNQLQQKQQFTATFPFTDSWINKKATIIIDNNKHIKNTSSRTIPITGSGSIFVKSLDCYILNIAIFPMYSY